MPDEMNELPRLLIRFGGVLPPCGHAGQTNAILDDVKEFAIRQGLGCRGRHVGSLGIEVLSDFGPAPTVVAVAEGAVVREMGPGFRENFRSPRCRIFHLPGLSRDRKVSHSPGDEGLGGSWLIPGAESV